jgi:Secretion system C-terminal sorting domain/Bacterial Ig domain
MKKFIFSIAMLFLAIGAFSQGLDSIIVEKYYVSNAQDSIVTAGIPAGTLPVGSITWRVYADLAPGYTLQAVYGVPGHNLVINSTTNFFNNEDLGSTSPNATSVNNIRKHSAMIDTWFSMSGNASGKVAVLKSEDGDGALVNANGILQNNDPSAAPAISSVDGMIAGTPPAVTFVGFTAAETAVFDNLTTGNSINTSNASVAVLGGVSGPTATNRVLIGQFTTTGIFHFELNLQLGTPSSGSVNYVASNPVGNEQTAPSLTGTFNVPNTPPTVSITSPANNATFIFPANFTVAVSANDPDGSISKVILRDGLTHIDSITGAGPYNFSYSPSVGSHALTAIAVDNNFAQTTSSVVNITVGNNLPPTISITAPANGTPYVAPALVHITTNANDPDGTVSQVEFLVDNVVVGTVLAPGPFTFDWASGAPFGTRHLTARATDNNNAVVTSAVVNITVSDPNALAYGIVSASNTCVPATFCLSVEARDTVQNVIGYDVVMHYDPVKVTPTGVVTVDNDIVNPAYVDVINSIDNANGLIYISLFFNGSAPASARFSGVGNIFCVEFAKTGNFANVDNTSIQVQSLQESYITGVTQVPADPGTYSTFRDTSFGGKLRFWFNNGPITYNSAIPSQHLITNIYGTDASCGNQSAAAVQPDLNGEFIYDINNGEKISIKKDIAAATSVQPVINGFDAFLTRRVLINDLAFLPNVYQMIAMDVNMDGVVSAGDLSQVNQRTVLILPEYKQAWNYDASGNPIPPVRASKDWVFIDNATVNTNLGFLISTTYPFDDGIGYSKFRVPQVPFCLSLPNSSADTTGDCAILVTETYKGILLGDVNGNFATAIPNSAFRANGADRVIFDVTKAVVGNGYVDVPVSIQYSGDVNALDFAFKFNESKLSLNSVVEHSTLESMSNYNANDKTFRYTSFSLQKYETNQPVVSVRFNITGQITAADLSSLEAYVNGERVGVELGLNADNIVNLFPNPATEMLNVVVSEDANVQLLDVSGSEVMANTLVYANQKHEINTANLASGVYMLKVSNGNFVSIKKVVIQK